jgi:hypothetical protein
MRTLAVVGSLAVVGCGGATSLRAQRVVEIYRAPPGASCATLDPRCRGSAATADGKLFVLLAEHREVEGLGQQVLRLLRSDDRGLHWAPEVEWACGGESEGSVLADPQLSVLHIVHATKEFDGAHLSLLHRTWDTERRAWQGEPVVVARATRRHDQFQMCDLELAADGTLLVTAMGFTESDAKLASYPAVLFLRPRGAPAWSPLVRLSQAPSGGGSPQIALAERVPTFVYASWGSDRFGLTVRRLHPDRSLRTEDGTMFDLGFPYDPRSLQRDALVLRLEAEPRVIPARNLRLANAFSAVAGIDGKLRLLHASRNAEQAELRLSIDPLGHSPKHVHLDLDSGLGADNIHYRHFGLARGPGAELIAVYSKLSESHAKLWTVRVHDDSLADPPRLLATGSAGSYAHVNTFRSSYVDSTLFAVVSGVAEDAPGGRVLGVGLFPARTTRVAATR